MFRAIRHGLGNLLTFSGRDARQAFWYYVLFVYIAMTVIVLVAVVPMMLQAFFAGIRQAAEIGETGDPLAAQAAAEAATFGAMATSLEQMAWWGSLTNLAMMALLAASLVRRLHDSNLSGWWALLPGAAQLANVVLGPAMLRNMMDGIGNIDPAMPEAGMQSLQNAMGMATVLGWSGIIIVVVLGIRPSTRGANRYGDAPFTA